MKEIKSYDTPAGVTVHVDFNGMTKCQVINYLCRKGFGCIGVD